MIIRVKDNSGNWVDIPALRGDTPELQVATDTLVGGIKVNASGTYIPSDDNIYFDINIDRASSKAVAIVPTANSTRYGIISNATYQKIQDVSTKLDAIAESLAGLNNIKTEELLWTNPDPTVDFTAKDIDLDLSGYDRIKVFARFSKSDTASTFQECSVGGRARLFTGYAGTTSGYQNVNVSRYFYCDTTKVSFQDGYYAYNTSGLKANDDLIPVSIYGIKFKSALNATLLAAETV